MTLFDAVRRADAGFALRVSIATVISASLLLAISARVAVPFYPVPMTMQTFVVIGIGLALGPWRGLAAVALYLAQGASGLPVFAGTPEKGIGILYMMGPTGGYLLGYGLAVLLAGRLARLGFDRRPLTAMAAALLAGAVIYIPGVLWLGVVIGFDKPLFELGVYPFLAGDVAKALLAALVFPAAWRWLARGGVR